MAPAAISSSAPSSGAPDASIPSAAPGDPKITPRHLAHQVLIYVRQSTPAQIQRHRESARRQYALTARAQQLGWAAEQVTIIDEDQGKSSAGSAAAHERAGFGRLVSAVGLGEVGLILALEVARLARNSAEWYRLLELARVLIGDEDTIYDRTLAQTEYAAITFRMLYSPPLCGTASACAACRTRGQGRSEAEPLENQAASRSSCGVGGSDQGQNNERGEGRGEMAALLHQPRPEQP
jgi:hypothetical protein